LPDKDIVLNDGQRTFLGATLHTIEEQLEWVERALTQDEERGITYRLRNPFPPEKRAQIQRALTQFKESLAQFHADFDLPVTEEDFGRRLRGALSGMWVNLTECHAKYVRAYGALPERTAKALDARAEQLLGLLDVVRRLIESQGG
jgi:hypothetical protein